MERDEGEAPKPFDDALVKPEPEGEEEEEE